MPSRSFVRRGLVLIVIFAVEFIVIEAGLRAYGEYAGATTFGELFMDDPAVGIRLRPNASIRYTTVEFTTDIHINAQGVRDDEPIGPKGPGEKRVVVLGDSLVLSVQVQAAQTFCERLEARLNSAASGMRWRVINAGVQGYGPVEQWMLFDRVVAGFEPDIVMMVVFVGNDALEAADAAETLVTGRPKVVTEPGARQWRRLIRSSVVLQAVRVRWDQLRSRFSLGTPERPLASYLADPPAVVGEGLARSREAFGRIADRARAIGAAPAFVLMPARFQVNDEDYGNLDAAVRQAGGVLDRQSASRRFADALGPLGVPMIDLQPLLAREPEPSGLFFQRNVHLTPRGHEVVAATLFDFLRTNSVLSSKF